MGDSWSEEPAAIKHFISEHFRHQFQKEVKDRVDFPSSLFSAKLDEADGSLLTSLFTEEEIRYSIWDCDGSRSPGPDGFNFIFFRNCWSIFKDDLLQVFADFHANSSLVCGSNTSFITLVPKKEGPAISNTSGQFL